MLRVVTRCQRTTWLSRLLSGTDGTRGRRTGRVPGVNGADRNCTDPPDWPGWTIAARGDSASLEQVERHPHPQASLFDWDPTDDQQKTLEELDGLGGTLLHDGMRRETLRQYVQRREQQFDQAAQHEVRLPRVARGLMHADGAELPDQGLQHLRTRTFGSLDAKAVGHALCELVRPSICPSSPLHPPASPPGVDADEEALAGVDRLDLTEEEARVLFEAPSKTWSTKRDQTREQRKDRQLFRSIDG